MYVCFLRAGICKRQFFQIKKTIENVDKTKSTDFELEIPLTNNAQTDTFSFTNTTPYKWYRLFFDVDNLHQRMFRVSIQPIFYIHVVFE